MLAPMLFGYAVGAVGVYALLYRLAPVRQEASVSAQTEVYTLFESEDAVRQAA